MKKRYRVFRLLVTLALITLLAFGASISSLSASTEVIPRTEIDGNDPAVGTNGIPATCTKFKPSPEPQTSRSYTDGTINVTLNFSGDAGDGQFYYVDWTSDRPICFVFVKGGNAGYLYDYRNASNRLSGTGLRAPDNDGGRQAAISHVTFYYGTPPTPETVSLVIYKDVIDAEGASLNSNTTHNSVSFPVTVNGHVYNLSVLTSPLVFTGLPRNSTYTIGESTSGMPQNYSFNKILVQGVESTTGEVTLNTSKTVRVVNRYTEPGTATLIVKKVLTGITSSRKFGFKVWSGSTEVGSGELGHLEEKSFNLPAGTYTVTENMPLPTYYSLVGISPASVALAAGETKTVTITNNYYEPPIITVSYNLSVYKNVVNAAGNSLNNSAQHGNVQFQVTVAGPGGYSATHNISAASPLFLSNLTAGEYTVTESTTLPTGYTYVSGNGSVTIGSSNPSGSITITNRHDEKDDEQPPERPSVKEAEIKPELPKTTGTDILLLALGAAIISGGMIVRRKRK